MILRTDSWQYLPKTSDSNNSLYGTTNVIPPKHMGSKFLILEKLNNYHKNILVGSVTSSCALTNIFTYHEWNNTDSAISNKLTVSPIIPTHLAGKTVTPTIDAHLPVARWNANISNCQLYSQYHARYCTKHKTMEARMFEQEPNHEYLEQWQTVMTSHNFDNNNTNSNNNNNSNSSPYAYLSLIKAQLSDITDENNMLRNTDAILVNGSENCNVCQSRMIACDKKIKNTIKRKEKDLESRVENNVEITKVGINVIQFKS